MEVLAITLIAALVSVISGLLVIIYSTSNIDLKKLLNSYVKLLSSKINPTSTVVKELPLSSSQNTALTLLTQKEKFIRDSFNSDVIKMINSNKTQLISSCKVYDALPAPTVNRLIQEEASQINKNSKSTKVTVSVEYSSEYKGLIAKIRLVSG